MNDRDHIIAYCSTLGAVVWLYSMSAALAAFANTTPELIAAAGLAAGATALIGILGTFKPVRRSEGVGTGG